MDTFFPFFLGQERIKERKNSPPTKETSLAHESDALETSLAPGVLQIVAVCCIVL